MNDSSATLPFIRLNISPNNLEEQIHSKIARITANPIASENALNEIRNLVFYSPMSDIESVGKPVAEKILTVAMQMNPIQSSKDIDNFRHELLSLLITLDFRFTSSTPIDKIANFFKFVSDGTISDLTEALLIIRRTFEANEGIVSEFSHEITKLTIASCKARMNWLFQRIDSIDSTYFSPFLNLLTVVSFCARKTIDFYHDQFSQIFSSIEKFISHDFPEKVSSYSIIPILALQSRMIHCYSLFADMIFKKKPIFVSLIDIYMALFRRCPSCYHILQEEITCSFVCLIANKKDPELILKYVEILPKLANFTTSDIDFYLTRQTGVIKLFESIIQANYCKLPIVDLILEFTINSLFVDPIPSFQRIAKFQKIIQFIFMKFKELPPPNFKYHFAILFAIHQFIKSISESTQREIKSIDQKSSNSHDFQQQIITISSQLFETINKIFECLLLLFDSVADCRFLAEKVVQVRSLNIPFSQVELEYIHRIFIDLIFLLIDVRYLSGQCNFRYAAQKITDDPYENSKLCVAHMKILKFYLEKVRQVASMIFQSFPKVHRKNFHPLFLTNLWNRFFNEFFQRSDKTAANSSFIFSLSQDFTTFSSIITCLLQLCIESINAPKKGSFVIQTAQFIFRRINTQPSVNYDSKDKVISATFLYLQKKVHKVILFFQKQLESIINLDEAILFIIEMLHLFVTFFKAPNKIPDILNPLLVERIIVVANQREVGKSLLNFFEFANIHAPKNIEYQQVIDLLIRHPADRMRSLNLIYLIGKRKKGIVYNDKERMKKLLSLILEVLPNSAHNEKVILLKMMRKLPTSRIININGSPGIQSGMKPTVVYDDYSVPLADLINATIQSLNSNQNNSPEDEKIDQLWIDLRSYYECLFGIPNDLQYIQAFQDELYTQKSVNSLIDLLKNQKEKSLRFVYDFSKQSIDFFSHFTITISYSQFTLSDSELFQLYSIIDSTTLFQAYLKKIITIYHICYPNLYIILGDIANNIVKNVAKSNIDSSLFALYITQYVTHRLPRKPSSFPGNRFKFSELETLPLDAQDLIEKAKDFLFGQHHTIFLEYLSDSCIKSNKYSYGDYPFAEYTYADYTYAEFISVCLNEDDLTCYLKSEYEHYQNNPYRFIKIISIILRICPQLIKQYNDQLDQFVQKEASNNQDKEKTHIINELLCSMARASPSVFLEKYYKKFYEMIYTAQDYSWLHIPFFKSIKESIPDSLMNCIRSFYIQKLREDGIETLMAWDTYQTMKLANLAKWNRIILYWQLAFLFLPSELTPTTLRQLAESVKTSPEIFYEIVQLLVTEDVICYLASENKYDVLMSLIAQGYLNFNLSIGMKEFRLLIDAIAYANDAGIRNLRSSIRLEKKFAFIQVAFEQEQHSQHLKEVILSDLEFVQSVLKADLKNISINSQFSFAAAALSDENIFLNPDLFQTIFGFYLTNLKFDMFNLNYAESFIQFIVKSIDKMAQNDVLRAVQLFFNANSQIVLSMISELVKEISKPKSNFKLNDLCQLTFDSVEIHFKYVKSILIKYLKNDNSPPGEFIRLIRTVKVPYILILRSILLVVIEMSKIYQITSDESFELYKKCTAPDEQHVAYEIWSRSQGGTHFEQIFIPFINSISVYLSSYQKRTCDNIKLPKNCSISLLNPLVKVILTFQKSAAILVSLWTIFANNLDCISNPLSLLWPMLIRQVLGLKQFAKKAQISYLIPLITILTKLICSSPPPENKDNFVIVYFANFLMHLLKMVIDSSTPKFIVPTIESAIELIKRFGGQLGLAKVYLKLILDIYQGNIKQQQQEIFPILMHFLSKILKYSVMHRMDLTGIINLEPICEMVFKIVCTIDSPSWPSAYMALNTLLQYGKCTNQIYNLAQSITNDEMWIRFSSILWKYEFPEDLRFTKILPIARKAFCTENSDSCSKKFMLTCLLMTIVSHPYENSLEYILQDISNPIFRNFFLKYFCVLLDFKPYIITFLNELIRDNNLDIDSIDLVNPHLKKLSRNKNNKFFVNLNGTLIEDQYKKLSQWPNQICFDLPELIRKDYIESFEKFSAFKMNNRHNLQLSILQTIQNQSELNQITTTYIETFNDIFNGINATKTALEHSIVNLPLKPLNLYQNEFAVFLMLSSSLKKKNPLSRTLSPLFPPLIHQSLKKFIKKLGISNEISEKHKKKFEKSLYLSFSTPKPPVPPPESFDSTSSSCKNLILSLSSKIGDDNYYSILFNVVITGLKLSGSHPLFMTTYFRLIESKIKEIDTLQFPNRYMDSFWSVYLFKLIKKYNIKRPSFYSYLHPSIHLALSNEESLNELVKQPLKSITNIIFGKRTFNSFDFQADVPFVANDKIASICSLIENQIVLIRSKSGNLYKYRITDDLLMDYEFTLLNFALNSLFKKFGDCRERGILLPIINAIPLSQSTNEIKYLSKTNFIPLHSLAKCDIPLNTKKENILWKSLLAENIGALCALQILLHGQVDLTTAQVDEKFAMIAFKNIVHNSPNLKLPLLIKNEMINGPVKNGIVSAFLCFGYYRAEVEHYLNSDYTNEHWDYALSRYLIPQSSAEKVDAEINELIEQSMNDETICPISWF